MEVVKVGDIFEFTIIALDKDRRRISLSLKSDAAERAGQSASMRTASKNGGENSNAGGGRRIVVVKKGEKRDHSNFNGDKKRPLQMNENRRKGEKFNRSERNDDGMTYNPFADLLKR